MEGPFLSGQQGAALVQSKAQKKSGPVLISRMSRVFSEEDNSFSQVEIQWKISWLCRTPIILDLDTCP